MHLEIFVRWINKYQDIHVTHVTHVTRVKKHQLYNYLTFYIFRLISVFLASNNTGSKAPGRKTGFFENMDIFKKSGYFWMCQFYTQLLSLNRGQFKFKFGFSNNPFLYVFTKMKMLSEKVDIFRKKNG